jgi:long-chain fatty acid transport protein
MYTFDLILIKESKFNLRHRALLHQDDEDLNYKLNNLNMKKILILFAGTLVTGTLLAGGLVTNTNQSASWVRLPSRNASTETDAVYYNPAGLMKMENGFHFGLSNQTIFQKRTITNNYSYLHSDSYEGSVKAPLFPSVAAAYKLGKFAVSFGFNPVGGGGSATYEAGLPSFEMSIADLVPATYANGFGTTDYSADIFFEGSSIYFGYQANLSYKINDMISVAAGLRLVTAKNTYSGYLRDISINPNYPAFGTNYNGSMNLASDFFTDGATTMTTLAGGATLYASGLQSIVTAGYGAVLLSNGTTVGLSPTDVATIQTILGAAGMTPTQIANATIAVAQGTLTSAAPVFSANATTMTGYAAATQDVEVDAEETGMGFAPILSVNISPIDNLNIAVKYEFLTKLELTTSLADPAKGGGIFIDNEKKRNDMPAMLALGVDYKLSKLRLTAGANYYFDKSADYGHKINGTHVDNSEIIDNNGMSVQAGLEFNISDNLLVSAGYVYGNLGVNSKYQSDLTFGNATHTFGGGLAYNITDMIRINLGGSYTMYLEDEKTISHLLGATDMMPKETYTKSTIVLGVGVELNF